MVDGDLQVSDFAQVHPILNPDERGNICLWIDCFGPAVNREVTPLVKRHSCDERPELSFSQDHCEVRLHGDQLQRRHSLKYSQQAHAIGLGDGIQS